MFCSKCDSPIPEGKGVCPNCGEKVSTDIEGQPAAKKGNIWISILVGILAAIAGMIGASIGWGE